MAQAFRPYRQPKLVQNQGMQALQKINAVPQNFSQSEGIQKPQTFPETTDERTENKFKALKSALARSTIGKPQR